MIPFEDSRKSFSRCSRFFTGDLFAGGSGAGSSHVLVMTDASLLYTCLFPCVLQKKSFSADGQFFLFCFL